uniref:Uncharacterized protein n=1 Tax=Oryza brachyantha TaxID=4533 RepID=J3MT05_ORYBR
MGSGVKSGRFGGNMKDVPSGVVRRCCCLGVGFVRCGIRSLDNDDRVFLCYSG